MSEQREQYAVKSSSETDYRRLADDIARAVGDYAYGSFVAGVKFSCELHSNGKNSATLKFAQIVDVR